MYRIYCYTKPYTCAYYYVYGIYEDTYIPYILLY
jgi:hypothetical protein